MRSKTGKRALILGSVLAVIVGVPFGFWGLLTHEPAFYRSMIKVSREQREEKAKRFMASSLQLRNDIDNEPRWEAIFSDEEVNAWLAQDLVTEFADQLPPEVHEPRIAFELDQMTLAFELDQGPIRSVIWVVARPNVPEPNVLEFTLEKIRAGVLPVPADKVIDRIVAMGRANGLDVYRKEVDDLPVVGIRYASKTGPDSVLLEQLQIGDGEMRLAGTSSRSKGIVEPPTLPTRKVLQSKFPRRKIQASAPSDEPASTSSLRTSAGPAS
ncbi:hypothetical protein ACYOEI_03270 [Singulisphaera rosea]